MVGLKNAIKGIETIESYFQCKLKEWYFQFKELEHTHHPIIPYMYGRYPFKKKRFSIPARVPQAPSCPPRMWSGAGVGVGMLRGSGDCLIWKQQKFLGFKVSNGWSFKIEKFQMSKFQSFKIPNSKSSRSVGHTFPNFTTFPNITSPKLMFLRSDLRFFLDYLECPAVSKDTDEWFWGSGARPKVPKS